MGQRRGQEDAVDVWSTRAVQRTNTLFCCLMHPHLHLLQAIALWPPLTAVPTEAWGALRPGRCLCFYYLYEFCPLA